MSHNLAGIDVHEKVVMVVVVDTHDPDAKPERRRFLTMPEDLHQLSVLVAGSQRGRSGDGIDGAVLALGVDGVGTAHAP